MANQTHAEWHRAATELKTQLESSPNELRLAKRYWSLISGETGFDVRSGAQLIGTFRSCAIKSDEGMSELILAFRKLANDTGEYPRADLIDPPLENALRFVARLSDHTLACEAAWILSLIENE